MARVTDISDAGTGAVYDLDCAPWHNFIAGGVVVQNCYASLQASEGAKISKKNFFDFLDDAASIGVKVKETISETVIAAAAVSPKLDMNLPTMPVMKPTGINTASSESVVARTAKPMSRVPSTAARNGLMPFSSTKR